MSVIVKGMEMPVMCSYCQFREPFMDYAYCHLAEMYMEYEESDNCRHPDCPLIELPPHGRLIAEKTITEIRYHDADGYHIVNGEQLCELEIDAETVIKAEGET